MANFERAKLPVSAETPSSGDFATHIEQKYLDGKLAPGQMFLPVKPAPFGTDANEALQRIQRRPGSSIAGWIVSLSTMAAMASLSFMALKEGVILIVNRHGNSTLEGSAAVVAGFAFLAAALIPAVNLSRHTKLFRPVSVIAILLWLAAVWVYRAQSHE